MLITSCNRHSSCRQTVWQQLSDRFGRSGGRTLIWEGGSEWNPTEGSSDSAADEWDKPGSSSSSEGGNWDAYVDGSRAAAAGPGESPDAADGQHELVGFPGRIAPAAGLAPVVPAPLPAAEEDLHRIQRFVTCLVTVTKGLGICEVQFFGTG
jgi:hypothetical protein